MAVTISGAVLILLRFQLLPEDISDSERCGLKQATRRVARWGIMLAASRGAFRENPPPGMIFKRIARATPESIGKR